MDIGSASREIIDTLQKTPSSHGERSNPWKELVIHFTKDGTVLDRYIHPVEKAIKQYIGTLADDKKIELWKLTEFGCGNDLSEGDIPIESIEMDLEVEFLEVITELALVESNVVSDHRA